MSLFSNEIGAVQRYEKPKSLNSCISRVNEIFLSIGLDVEFFIAGGSVFSLLNNNDKFEDIDIYFYSKSDMEKAINLVNSNLWGYVTENAITLTSDFKYQLIKIQYGDVHEVLNGFDISCSKVAYTSNKSLIFHPDYSIELKYNFDNVRGSSVNRYWKYIDNKGALDIHKLELKKLIDFLILNYNVNSKCYYNNLETKFITSLQNIIVYYQNITNEIPIIKYIYESINDVKSSQDKIDIFQQLSFVINDKYLFNKTEEYLVAELIKKIDGFFVWSNSQEYRPTNKEKELMYKYAEFFI